MGSRFIHELERTNVIPVPSTMLSQLMLIISSYPWNIITVFLKDIF